MLDVGDQAPDFTAQDQHSETHHLKNNLGKWVLLYFYPKDDTPGCAKEAQAFRDAFQLFLDKNIVVLGVSADSVDSHKRFAAKYRLPFSLLSDTGQDVIHAYSALGAMGQAKRISYLINDQGIITRKYIKVRPEQHASEILRDFAELTQNKSAGWIGKKAKKSI